MDFGFRTAEVLKKKKSSSSGTILKVESMLYMIWLDIECQKGWIGDDFMIFGLRSLQYVIGFNYDEKAATEAHFREGMPLGFVLVKFDKKVQM